MSDRRPAHVAPGLGAPRNELDLLDRLRRRWGDARSANGGLHLGIGDDGALLEPRPGWIQAVSKDLLIEGVHFRRDWASPEDIAWKALAVNLSDLAAMGAEPQAVFLGLGIPADSDRPVARPEARPEAPRHPSPDGLAWAQSFLDGLAVALEHFHVPLAGGDTVRSPGGMVLSVTVTGWCDRPLRRDSARPGDEIWLSGDTGLAAAGLTLLQRAALGNALPSDAEPEQAALHAHLRPTPALALGRILARGPATAAIDVSDGLAQDLGHLLAASGVGGILNPSRPWESRRLHGINLPTQDLRTAALHGGEDYVLVFTLPPGSGDALRNALADANLPDPVRPIGTVIEGAGVWLDSGHGPERVQPQGWDHFRYP